ncbi:glucose-6-phosphate dehydrogenase assembly protein OpcA [Microcella daejeonensis]|uniref:Glucose-6-phosphate dehydrogenase assembly protein OpcA n=1 Tax=Microcella daejeonensis TaxID=2994971 RepID=A0A9E8MKK8_9MICO|nr:glucose-6-phosphate dehydrogenase assembly protein OpcA [Microcella daejeonensis]WAB81243.1 glucose-6-phosphate dehydrogenase assembly protein OpcA [Microcella daejeonensis]WAB83408.1 glucose-6-phosphate dehydrogenase assembly protein OpcA [Microcella daejeonensis]
MIITLPDTTTSKVTKTLVRIRDEAGAVALGRVLTLIIATSIGEEEDVIAAANDASREHPMRIIVVSTDRADADARLDAEIRVGGDAGASEVVVLRAHGDAARDQHGLVTGLLLPDAPVVTWWPGECPSRPGETPLGDLAQRRITDAAASADPLARLERLAREYEPGDTDFAWTRLTLWRAQLAAALDQPPYEPVERVEVEGPPDSPSTVLLAAWLRRQLQVPVEVRVVGDDATAGLSRVVLHRSSGPLTLERTEPAIARLTQAGQPTHELSLPRRTLRECLAEELRRLDPDDVFGDVLRSGLEPSA